MDGDAAVRWSSFQIRSDGEVRIGDHIVFECRPLDNESYETQLDSVAQQFAAALHIVLGWPMP